MSAAKQQSALLKEEANRLLASTKLEARLAQFGNVELGGSYAYDLLVDRDLDFGGAVQSITPDIRAKIASEFASQPWVYSVNMTYRVNFEPLSNLGAPRGLYLSLTIPFPVERWNIDVWFMVAAKLPEDEMAGLIAKASPAQKDTILEIKYQLMTSDQKQKGLTSSEIYKAIIRGGVSSAAEFLELRPWA